MTAAPDPAPPLVLAAPAQMSAWSDAARARGQRIAFVPTMGALHAGHVALLEEGRRRGDLLALSIFVNPTQFGPREDLDRYPRDLPGDLAKAAAAGCHVAFAPDRAAMYPDGHQTTVEVHELERGMCGDARPGHFVGVATIVCKLFNIVRPHVAIFGEKDFQQLAVVRRMARDLDMPVEIVGHPTVREADGLALSSRNRFLSPAERARALALSRGLFAARARHAAGERDAAALLAEVRAHLLATAAAAAAAAGAGAGAVARAGEGDLRVDYLDLRDADTLRPVSAVDRPAVLAVAAYVGATRLIDNVRIG